MVLVAEDHQPPQQWITARVIETHASDDGRLRVAVVRTSFRVFFKIGVHKLARLPVGRSRMESLIRAGLQIIYILY